MCMSRFFPYCYRYKYRQKNTTALTFRVINSRIRYVLIVFWGSNDFKETSKRKSVITVIVRQKINVLV